MTAVLQEIVSLLVGLNSTELLAVSVKAYNN